MKVNRYSFTRKFTLASLANRTGQIRIQAAEDKVWITGRDDSGTYISVLEQTTEAMPKPMDVVVQSDKLSSILGLVSSAELAFEQKADGSLVITADSDRFEFRATEAATFHMPSYTSVAKFTTKTQGLVAAIKATVFATDVSSTRYQLGGVAFDLHEDVLSTVACDGRRLAVCELPASGSLANVAIVPQKAIKQLVTILANSKCEDCEVEISNTLIAVSTADGTHFVCNLIDGRYPNWRQVEPSKDGRQPVTLKAGECCDSIRKSTIFADKDSRKVDLTMADGMLRFDVKTETGESEVAIPIVYDGDKYGFSVDHKFLLDFFAACDVDDAVELWIKSPGEPVFFESAKGYRYTLMPMAKT
jgi:DNA polymerase III subunit beta